LRPTAYGWLRQPTSAGELSVIPEEERPLLAASNVAHYTVYGECSLDAPAV
jgi:hypothetical protein